MTRPHTRPPLPEGVHALDAARPDAVAAWLAGRGLIVRGAACRVERAGEGNMNLTLRVTTPERSLIVKQGRPWVEKYDHIAAPWGRTLVEGAFYRAVASVPDVRRRLPALVDLDETSHILVLEDLGSGGDLTSVYATGTMTDEDVDALLAWLAALADVPVAAADRERFANRAMRALNHEHIFRFPLRPDNGLDLNGITPGLSAAAAFTTADAPYVASVARLGDAYLADGAALVHGDYFPGSWVRAAGGLRIIDPEFCFLGAREFDYGVMLAHLALARVAVARARRIESGAGAEGLDLALVRGFAGVEIMRRLIGVAQLPLPYGLAEKQRLLALSRALVVNPRGEATW